MANIRKSFNFRNGVQIDNNKFVVNANGLVGIGTSVPLAPNKLDVHGDARITGLATVNNVSVSEGLEVLSGITTVGFITATSGNVSGMLTAGNLTINGQITVGNNVVDNLVGFAFTTFISDNAGVGLHTTSKIGINTSTSPGASDSELTVVGNVDITGITTTQSLVTQSLSVGGVATASTFSGSGALLTSIPNSATTATFDNVGDTIVSRDALGGFSGGIITATSSFDGTSTLSQGLTGSPAITVASVDSTGIVKSNTRVITPSIGVGTESPNAAIHIRKSGIASIQLTSDSEYSVITFGENLSETSDNGQIRYGYGNALGDAEFSTEQSLDIINTGTDNLNFYLNPSGFGTAFNWLTNASTRAMVLTRTGNLGINSTSPSDRLVVGGDASITGDLSVVGSGKSITSQKIVKVGGSSTEFLKADGSVDNSSYMLVGAALTSVQQDTSPTLGGTLSLDGNLITGIGTISINGKVTASRFNGDGSELTGIAGTARYVAFNSTGSIGAGTTADITITGQKAYSLFKVETSHAAWVRLYTDTTSRTNDASRVYTTDPTPGSGVLAEVYTTTSGIGTFKMTPAVVGWNDDATPSTNIYAKVTNNESTSQDITVSLTILRMEI